MKAQTLRKIYRRKQETRKGRTDDIPSGKKKRKSKRPCEGQEVDYDG